MPSPRLRFAPSPTGPLHLGSAVVAVANALGARALGGELLLRIDDTDAERTAEGAERGILTDLAWLGLEHAGEPVHQSARREQHVAAAEGLLATAHAYRCFCPPSQERYDGRCRSLPRADAERRHEAGEENVVRFRVPSAEVVVEDATRGPVRFAGDEISDFVLLRADGRPTFDLASCVDDRDLGITHIVRGEDHLANSARHLILLRALGRGRARLRALPDHRRGRRRAALDAQRRRASRGAACARRAPRGRGRLCGAARLPRAGRRRRGCVVPRARAALLAHAPRPRHRARRSGASGLAGPRSAGRAACRRARPAPRAVPAARGRRPSCSRRSPRRRVAPRRSVRSRTLLWSCHSVRPDRHRTPPALELFRELREADVREHLPYADAVELVATLRAQGKSRGLAPRDVLHPLRIALTGAPHGLPLPVVVAVLPREEALERCRT